MNQSQLDTYKEKLLRERTMLISEVKSHERPVNLGSDTEDIDEEIDKEEAFSNELSVARDLRKRLDEIDVALSKIYNRTYGVCELCGKAILAEVLENDPASRFCKRCRPKA